MTVRLFLSSLLLLLALGGLFLIPACGQAPSDDDDSAGDDDDATDDDDTAGDDDDASGDDDDSASDDDDIISDDDDASGDDDDSAEDLGPCEDRTEGAMISFSVGSGDKAEGFTFWISGDEFIDTALTHVGAGVGPRAGFQIVTQSDCDVQWEFHAVPDSAFWYASPPFFDHCDVLPSTIAGDPNGWNTKDNVWCPSDLQVMEVEDRRASAGDDDDSSAGDDDDSSAGDDDDSANP